MAPIPSTVKRFPSRRAARPLAGAILALRQHGRGRPHPLAVAQTVAGALRRVGGTEGMLVVPATDHNSLSESDAFWTGVAGFLAARTQ